MIYRQLCLNFGKRNPLLCAKINSVPDKHEYIRRLLNDYSRDPSLFNQPNPVMEDVGTDFTPQRFNIAIYNREAWEVLQLENNMSEFIQRLIYLDIGRDPDDYVGEEPKRKARQELFLEREKELAERKERLARCGQKVHRGRPTRAEEFVRCFANYVSESRYNELLNDPNWGTMISAVKGFLTVFPIH